jgi:hypothetical protein
MYSTWIEARRFCISWQMVLDTLSSSPLQSKVINYRKLLNEKYLANDKK